MEGVLFASSYDRIRDFYIEGRPGSNIQIVLHVLAELFYHLSARDWRRRVLCIPFESIILYRIDLANSIKKLLGDYLDVRDV